jgi:hypothetical protein
MSAANKFDGITFPEYNIDNNSIKHLLSAKYDINNIRQLRTMHNIPITNIIEDKTTNNLLHMILEDNNDMEEDELLIIIKYLLQNNIDITKQNIHNNTPLHFAAKNNYKNITKTLLIHGATPNVKNSENVFPIHYALSGKFVNFIDRRPKILYNYLDENNENLPFINAIGDKLIDYIQKCDNPPTVSNSHSLLCVLHHETKKIIEFNVDSVINKTHDNNTFKKLYDGIFTYATQKDPIHQNTEHILKMVNSAKSEIVSTVFSKLNDTSNLENNQINTDLFNSNIEISITNLSNAFKSLNIKAPVEIKDTKTIMPSYDNVKFHFINENILNNSETDQYRKFILSSYMIYNVNVFDESPNINNIGVFNDFQFNGGPPETFNVGVPLLNVNNYSEYIYELVKSQQNNINRTNCVDFMQKLITKIFTETLQNSITSAVISDNNIALSALTAKNDIDTLITDMSNSLLTLFNYTQHILHGIPIIPVPVNVDNDANYAYTSSVAALASVTALNAINTSFVTFVTSATSVKNKTNIALQSVMKATNSNSSDDLNEASQNVMNAYIEAINLLNNAKNILDNANKKKISTTAAASSIIIKENITLVNTIVEAFLISENKEEIVSMIKQHSDINNDVNTHLITEISYILENKDNDYSVESCFAFTLEMFGRELIFNDVYFSSCYGILLQLLIAYRNSSETTFPMYIGNILLSGTFKLDYTKSVQDNTEKLINEFIINKPTLLPQPVGLHNDKLIYHVITYVFTNDNNLLDTYVKSIIDKMYDDLLHSTYSKIVKDNEPTIENLITLLKLVNIDKDLINIREQLYSKDFYDKLYDLIAFMHKTYIDDKRNIGITIRSNNDIREHLYKSFFRNPYDMYNTQLNTYFSNYLKVDTEEYLKPLLCYIFGIDSIHNTIQQLNIIKPDNVYATGNIIEQFVILGYYCFKKNATDILKSLTNNELHKEFIELNKTIGNDFITFLLLANKYCGIQNVHLLSLLNMYLDTDYVNKYNDSLSDEISLNIQKINLEINKNNFDTILHYNNDIQILNMIKYDLDAIQNNEDNSIDKYNAKYNAITNYNNHVDTYNERIDYYNLPNIKHLNNITNVIRISYQTYYYSYIQANTYNMEWIGKSKNNYFLETIKITNKYYDDFMTKLFIDNIIPTLNTTIKEISSLDNTNKILNGMLHCTIFSSHINFFINLCIRNDFILDETIYINLNDLFAFIFMLTKIKLLKKNKNNPNNVEIKLPYFLNNKLSPATNKSLYGNIQNYNFIDNSLNDHDKFKNNIQSGGSIYKFNYMTRINEGYPVKWDDKSVLPSVLIDRIDKYNKEIRHLFICSVIDDILINKKNDIVTNINSIIGNVEDYKELSQISQILSDKKTKINIFQSLKYKTNKDKGVIKISNSDTALITILYEIFQNKYTNLMGDYLNTYVTNRFNNELKKIKNIKNIEIQNQNITMNNTDIVLNLANNKLKINEIDKILRSGFRTTNIIEEDYDINNDFIIWPMDYYSIMQLDLESLKKLKYHNTLVTNLLDYGANINAQDSNNRSPIYNIIDYSYLHAFKFLIENRADVFTLQDINETSPFKYCILNHIDHLKNYWYEDLYQSIDRPIKSLFKKFKFKFRNTSSYKHNLIKHSKLGFQMSLILASQYMYDNIYYYNENWTFTNRLDIINIAKKYNKQIKDKNYEYQHNSFVNYCLSNPDKILFQHNVIQGIISVVKSIYKKMQITIKSIGYKLLSLMNLLAEFMELIINTGKNVTEFIIKIKNMTATLSSITLPSITDIENVNTENIFNNIDTNLPTESFIDALSNLFNISLTEIRGIHGAFINITQTGICAIIAQAERLINKIIDNIRTLYDYKILIEYGKVYFKKFKSSINVSSLMNVNILKNFVCPTGVNTLIIDQYKYIKENMITDASFYNNTWNLFINDKEFNSSLFLLPQLLLNSENTILEQILNNDYTNEDDLLLIYKYFNHLATKIEKSYKENDNNKKKILQYNIDIIRHLSENIISDFIYKTIMKLLTDSIDSFKDNPDESIKKVDKLYEISENKISIFNIPFNKYIYETVPDQIVSFFIDIENGKQSTFDADKIIEQIILRLEFIEGISITQKDDIQNIHIVLNDTIKPFLEAYINDVISMWSSISNNFFIFIINHNRQCNIIKEMLHHRKQN